MVQVGQDAVRPDLIGRTVGDYRVMALLGEGGQGAKVYCATDRRSGRTVALKVLPRVSSAGPETAQRFRLEAQAIQRLQHPNVVQVYGFGDVEGLAFIAMEYIEGGSLEKRMKSGQPLDLALVSRWVAEIASALDDAHSQGIVHRDVKPGNVLLADATAPQEGERAVLTDFGIARFASLRQTLPGKIVGTPTYISPEQAQGRKVDGRSDVYSLGVLVYEMLAGCPPFSGRTLALLHNHVHDRPPPIRRFNPRLSRRTQKIIGQALAKDPDKRYPTAGQFSRDLSASLVPHTRTGPVPKGHGDNGKRRPSSTSLLTRLRPMFGYIAMVALVIAGGVLVVLVLGSGNGRATPGPQMPASASAPGGVLAFARGMGNPQDPGISAERGTQICLLDVATGVWWPLTSGEAQDLAPAWSPDGSRLAFSSDRDGNHEIYVMDADGASMERLTDHPAWDSGPTWAPNDGGPARIAFDSERVDQSVLFAVELGSGRLVQLTDAGVQDGEPDWSPDGRWIAFNSQRGGDLGLYVVDVENGDVRRLSAGLALDSWPAWSPDGRSIAFSRGNPQGDMDIYVVGADGTGERRILDGNPTACCPSWSPDGEWIAFSRSDSGEMAWDLCVMRASGQDVWCLLSDGYANRTPVWKP